MWVGVEISNERMCVPIWVMHNDIDNFADEVIGRKMFFPMFWGLADKWGVRYKYCELWWRCC
jgi:hypothetical protein